MNKTLVVNEKNIQKVLSHSNVLEKEGSKTLTGYASVDKPWLKYYDEGVTDTLVPDMSIYQAIKENNKNRPNNIAIELCTSANDFNKGIEITYKEYFKRMEDIARSYINMGLKPNDMVITVLPNIPESRMLIYGLNILGVTVYPVSFMMSAGQLDAIISENDVKNVVMFAGFYEKYEKVLANRNLDSMLYVTGMESAPKLMQMMDRLKKGNPKKTLTKENVLLWDEFDKLKKGYKGELEPYYDEDHVAVVVGTSGTTGVPKGVCLTDKNLNAIALQHGLSGILDEEETMLDALIQSIGYGISTMHYSTYYGYRNILIAELLFERTAEVICKKNPDHFTGGPVHAENIIKSKEYQEGKLPILRNLVSGGATLKKEIERELNGVDEGFSEKGKTDPRIRLRQGFGATENGGCGAYAKPGAYKFGGLGIPLPLDTIAIFEPGTDHELQYNQEGEICISGPTIMKGYLNNPKETENVLKVHSDGTPWLHLADLGYMDEDGQLYIIDRIKDIFMRTGFNVHPSKIEEYIYTLPGVKDCKVIGYDHPDEQKVPVAFISLTEEAIGHEEEVLSNIQTQCYENLEETSIPYDWVIVPEMVRNLGGKIDSKILTSSAGIDYMKDKKPICKVLKLRS